MWFGGLGDFDDDVAAEFAYFVLQSANAIAVGIVFSAGSLDITEGGEFDVFGDSDAVDGDGAAGRVWW